MVRLIESSRRFLFVATASVFFGCSVSEGKNPICERYIAALKSPAVAERLDEFYTKLPKTFVRANLKSANYKFAGLGRYTVPLGFDASEIGLSSEAEARFSLVENTDELAALIITDSSGVGFFFRVNEDIKHFEHFTLPEARTERVGVMCLRRD